MNAHSYQPLQTVPPAPGGGVTLPSQGTPPPVSPPAGAPPSGGMSTLFMFVAILPAILLVLWSGRSQQRKQKDLESKMKKGDRVSTQSGLIGRVVELGDARTLRVEIAPGVKVQMLKSAITGIEAESDGSKGKDESLTSEKKT